jgi:hypothetical protein
LTVESGVPPWYYRREVQPGSGPGWPVLTTRRAVAGSRSTVLVRDRAIIRQENRRQPENDCDFVEDSVWETDVVDGRLGRVRHRFA